MNGPPPIRLTRVAASLALRERTALAGCTQLVEGDTIARNWPSLSSGEEVLWRILAWINGAGDLPTWSDVSAALDEHNLAAVRGVYGMEAAS